jgi:hypothetical protein
MEAPHVICRTCDEICTMDSCKKCESDLKKAHIAALTNCTLRRKLTRSGYICKDIINNGRHRCCYNCHKAQRDKNPNEYWRMYHDPPSNAVERLICTHVKHKCIYPTRWSNHDHRHMLKCTMTCTCHNPFVIY